ncbi:MAG: hypothetical protein HXY50_09860, partial [Ignavibacteriaceae bacterium]|nr:hypothetical protein [Ignavibacteriaceae bacterium]
GKIREIGFFKDGKKDGAWTVFDEKGKIKRKIFFKDGLIIDDKNLNQSYTT